MADRIFSEVEVQKLIRRAAQLEAERSVTGRSGGKNGLTIDELKTVASESGLDPKLIDQAASEYVSGYTDVQDKVEVHRDEIVSEIWLDSRPDSDTMDALITELNHMYGTTDELNWWENLWGTHEGKAKVKRSSTMAEWNYKTEAGMYSTRVLMQQRGERFRIRVSKRQIMNLEWKSPLISLLIMVPFFVLLAVFGGVASSQLFGMAWPGILSGMLLSLFSYPVIQQVIKRSVKKQKSEVANTAGQLSQLILQSSDQNKKEREKGRKNHSVSEIELPDEPHPSDGQPGRLRNNLRE